MHLLGKLIIRECNYNTKINYEKPIKEELIKSKIRNLIGENI